MITARLKEPSKHRGKSPEMYGRCVTLIREQTKQALLKDKMCPHNAFLIFQAHIECVCIM